ncbi:hypothetical protein RRU94_02480 [Domibacillus sp. DTU_2020_1001157_1_SI_ALB_TIR_016]|uniref:hypothetical protein n=1 Tax=Domibacillus sp. DTU_2020_1001157_1_SI_ALB_TIR_016 TaxID=3077789 RepID=UPI0028EA61B1|nr:hypothetical protein [Domibacillus sp. DTU_2020_1001157_1_SI_ALB_TIR_016]WNS78831.1 hypothetical protein RRU94_02480 [Domibacillus sp. DTU_2020_1001157_1_SI_ALB_TIR_016]
MKMILIDEIKLKKNKHIMPGAAVLDESNLVLEKERKEKKAAVKSSFAQISPVVDVTNNDFFEMRSGEYMEIIQIESKDIYSLNDADLSNDIQNLATFLTAYTEDIKIVPLNIPLNLEKQKSFIYKRLRQNKNTAYQSFLESRLREFDNLEKHRTNREYFIFMYAEEEKKLLEKLHQIKNLLARSNPVTELSIEKKINILFQMFNPNTKPLSETE